MADTHPLIHLRQGDTKRLCHHQAQGPAKKVFSYKKNHFFGEIHDTQTGMLRGIPRSARCVQRFDDSLNSAIHITYRVSLRSSSMGEPRDPLSKVILLFLIVINVQKT